MFDNSTPMYRVLATAGFFGPDDTLYEEGAEIRYDGVPNEELEPLNEPARVKLTAYLEMLDLLGKEAAAKANRPWVGRPRHLDGQLALATAIQKSEMGILGSKTKDETSLKIEKVTAAEIPDTGLTPVKRGRGRPPGSGKKSVSLATAAA